MKFNKNRSVIFIVFILAIVLFLILLAPIRIYVAARCGYSEAMIVMAEEYYKNGYQTGRVGLFGHSVSSGDYWLRKSANSGNINAIKRMIRFWELSNPHEVVYWLNHGCGLGIPWCAEEMAVAYELGRYRLPQDFHRTGKAREYDELAVTLHRKKGTLKEHQCILLPRIDHRIWPRPVSAEIHPGIPRDQALKKRVDR